MMTINFKSLEEQVAFIAKIMESLTASKKTNDEQITFMMEKITTLTRAKPKTSNQKQHLSLQEKGENSIIEVAKNNNKLPMRWLLISNLRNSSKRLSKTKGKVSLSVQTPIQSRILNEMIF